MPEIYLVRKYVLQRRYNCKRKVLMKSRRRQEEPTCEAPFRRASFKIKHWINAFQTAWRKVIIVLLVARRRPCKHNEVTIFTSWRALFRIVLYG